MSSVVPDAPDPLEPDPVDPAGADADDGGQDDDEVAAQFGHDTDSGSASRAPKLDVIGTAVFVAALAVAIPLREERTGQIVIAATSMVLFAIGVATCLWAYTSALDRSRVHEVGVANLFLLTGRTAPPRVKRTMWLCLAAQVVLAVAGASIGVAGLESDQLNALAFGVLVPMFGIGLNGIWAVRHGTFGPRVARVGQPTNRKID